MEMSKINAGALKAGPGKQKPLAMATTDHIQGNLFEDDMFCDSGYCFI
jgi:hypothetical protein